MRMAMRMTIKMMMWMRMRISYEDGGELVANMK